MAWIAAALRDLLLDNTAYQSLLRELAMTCHTWRRLFSPLRWSYRRTIVTSLSQLHSLEEIVSSPLSSTLKDHINYLHLSPRWDNGDKDSYRFLSAWRSLSRCLYQVIYLEIGASRALQAGPHPHLKSPSISLRPCPRPLLHLRNLELAYVTFPTFSALFRDIGALPSLERLSLRHIQWNRAYDPQSPPSSTATFCSIRYIYAYECTDGSWPLIWMFTASSLRYRHPLRAVDDAEEMRICSVREDVRAIGRAFAWVLSSAGSDHDTVRLEYVDCAPKGI